jgi:hypothetical protein
MNNKLYYYQPHTIYTRLNDVFEEGTKKDLEDFNPENFIKPNLIGKVIEQNMNSISKEIKMKKNKLNDEILKKRYVNKDLIESWIGAIQTSR